MWAVNLVRRAESKKFRKAAGKKLSIMNRCWDCCHCNLARNAAKIGCMSSTLGQKQKMVGTKTQQLQQFLS